MGKEHQGLSEQIHQLVEARLYDDLYEFLQDNRALILKLADKKQNNLLHHAVVNYEIEAQKIISFVCRELLNYQNVDGFTPVGLAVLGNKQASIEYFVKIGFANLSACDGAGNSILTLAAQRKNKSIILLLINCVEAALEERLSLSTTQDELELEVFVKTDKKATLDSTKVFQLCNMLTNEQASWLHFLAKIDDLRIFERAAGLSPNLLYACDSKGLTPFHYAMIANAENVINWYLSRKDFKLRLKDASGSNLLHFASEYCSVKYFHQLRKKGLSINSVNLGENSSLHVLARYNRVEIIDYLIREGVELSFAENSRGHDPVTIAVKRGNHLVVLQLLKYIEKRNQRLSHSVQVTIGIRQQFNLNSLDKRGFNALHYATCLQNPLVLEALVKSKLIDINCRDGYDGCALLTAAAGGNIAIFQFIYFHPKCNVAITDQEAKTALHIAAELGNLSIVGQILQREINFNPFDKRYLTPLHYAAYNGHYDVVELMLMKGISQLQDKNGCLPLDYVNKSDARLKRLLINDQSRACLRRACHRGSFIEIKQLKPSFQNVNLFKPDSRGKNIFDYLLVYPSNPKREKALQLLCEDVHEVNLLEDVLVPQVNKGYFDVVHYILGCKLLNTGCKMKAIEFLEAIGEHSHYFNAAQQKLATCTNPKPEGYSALQKIH